MRGLLADVNVEGHLRYLTRLMDGQGTLEILTELGISLVTFRELGLDRGMDDRALWNFCQQNGMALFTDNRNQDDKNSLNATLQDSWREGYLPVLTLADKGKFENSETYAMKVAQDLAELLVVGAISLVRVIGRV